MKIETQQVGSRVEVAVYATGKGRGDGPAAGLGHYDDPSAAIDDARGFLNEALAAAHNSGARVLDQQERMTREHAAWLDVGNEFHAKGINVNDGGWSQLMYAIQKWGEELVQLRLGDPSYTEQALREKREAYEGQYERGEYPSTPGGE